MSQTEESTLTKLAQMSDMALLVLNNQVTIEISRRLLVRAQARAAAPLSATDQGGE